MTSWYKILHFTQCGACKRLIALSNSADIKVRMVHGWKPEDDAAGYKYHMVMCREKYGDNPKIIRWRLPNQK